MLKCTLEKEEIVKRKSNEFDRDKKSGLCILNFDPSSRNFQAEFLLSNLSYIHEREGGEREGVSLINIVDSDCVREVT